MKRKYDELEARYLNPLIDFGFHKLFGEESNKDLLIDFLNEIIREEGRITDIQYLVTEQWGNFKTDRKAVFDIFCKTEKEEYFIVEMQNAKQPFFRDRSIFYASLPIQKQAPKGFWDYRLNKIYLVAILDFVLFEDFEDDKEYVVERVQLVRERTKTVYSNVLEFAFVELPKFKKTEKELKSHFDKWLFILKNLSKLKARPASIQGEVFEKLFELAEIKQLTKKNMETYRKSILKYHDVRLAVDCDREEGVKEGIEKGRREGIEKGIEKGRRESIEKEKNMIQKCLQKNMAIEDIVFLTGYTKEQIISFQTKN